MIKLLATLTDPAGRVTLPGFYDDVRPVSLEERVYYESIVHEAHGASSTAESLVALWRMPSFTVHRVSTSGPGHATVIPNSVEASLSIRIEMHVVHRADWWQRSVGLPYWDALADAVEAEWGEKPIDIREGGSIPGIAILEKELGAQAVHLPMGQASDHAHLPNERIRLVNLSRGQSVVRRFFQALGNMP